MNSKDFDQVLKEVFAKVEGVLGAKASEYADDLDRLRNFKLSAALKEESPRQALMGMLVKHTVSVYDLGLADVTNPSLAVWDEKLIDHINYLILLRALVVEELEGK